MLHYAALLFLFDLPGHFVKGCKQASWVLWGSLNRRKWHRKRHQVRCDHGIKQCLSDLLRDDLVFSVLLQTRSLWISAKLDNITITSAPLQIPRTSTQDVCQVFDSLSHIFSLRACFLHKGFEIRRIHSGNIEITTNQCWCLVIVRNIPLELKLFFLNQNLFSVYSIYRWQLGPFLWPSALHAATERIQPEQTLLTDPA